MRRRRSSLLCATRLTIVLAVVAVAPALARGALAGGGDPGFDPVGLSCVTVGNCTAVGNFRDWSDGEFHDVLITEADGRWLGGVKARYPSHREPDPIRVRGSSTRADQSPLTGVSCASTGNCTAVGYYGDAGGGGRGVVLTEAHGRWARGTNPRLPANAASGANQDEVIYAISCPSAGACTAVGTYTDTSEHRQGLLLTESHGRWARGIEARLPVNPGPSTFAFGHNVRSVVVVSCASAGNCSAFGFYVARGNHLQGVLLTERDGRWARGVEARLPAHAAANPFATGPLDVLNPGLSADSLVPAGPFAASCGSPGNCAVVGTYTDTSRHQQGLLLTQRRGRWEAGVQARVPAGAAADPFSSDDLSGYLGLVSVSCAAAGSCTAVGTYRDGLDNEPHGLLLTETNGSWSRRTDPPIQPGAVGGLDSVSCPSAGECTAGGYYSGLGYESGQAVLLSETDGAWGAQTIPTMPANAGTKPYDGVAPLAVTPSVSFVSCPSSGDCTAIGDYTDRRGRDQGLLLSETNGVWSTGVEATLP